LRRPSLLIRDHHHCDKSDNSKLSTPCNAARAFENAMIDKDVVLLIDCVDARDLRLEGANLEMADAEEYDELVDAIGKVSRRVVPYQTLQAFLDNIAAHRDDVVLSVWSGERSRNRKVLVPSICEAYGITYVGADAYASMVAQDKALSKTIAQKFGFTTPRAVVIDAPSDVSLLDALRYPIVVKPNLEGGSIGISQDCLTHDARAAAEIARRLLGAHGGAVIAEEFVRGREISYVIVGSQHETLLAEAVEIVLVHQDLRETVWSYELKQSPTIEDYWQLVTDELPVDVLRRGIDLFRSLGKVELMRIDGRLDAEGTFHFIELSPDSYLGSDGAVGAAYSLRGMTLDVMMDQLLRNALQNR
jgi:D-alanine-D-alanine ligase